jgi:5,10-methylenetetrahydromethanopterin reductase
VVVSIRFGFSGANLSTNVDSFDEVVSVVKFGEDLGYDSAWITDRIRDAYVTLAACALATKRIRLCTGAVSSYSRHPLANARSFASLDELCNGRQAMCLTVGNKEAAKQLGIDTSGGYERVKEMCVVTKKLFSGEAVNFEGKYFTLRGVTLGIKARKNIQVYVAGSGPKIMEVAGEVADGVIIPYGNAEIIKRAKESIRAGALRAGRNPESVNLVGWLPTYLTDDRERVLGSLRGFAAMQLVLSPFEWLRETGITEAKYLAIREKYSRRAIADPKLDSDFWHRAREDISDDVVESLTLVGNSKQIVSKMDNFSKSGFSEFSLWLPTPDLAQKRRLLETFAVDVAPLFH